MIAKMDEARFRALVELSLDAMALIESDGKVTYVSPAITRILGYSPDEFCLKSPFELVHPEDQEKARTLFKKLLDNPGDSQSVANRVQHKDGSWRWVETSSVNQLHKSGVNSVISNFRDVTDRMRAAEAIREAEERFRLIVESATEFAIFTTDLAGRVNSWNSGANRLLGYTEEEIIGQHCRIFFTPEDRSKSQPDNEMLDAVTEGSGEDEKWHVRKDGSRFWGSGLMMPFRDDSGEVRGYLKIFRDMTREKLADEKLKEQDRRKDEFLATLAHELRNPLAAISNAALLMKLPAAHQNLEWSYEVINRQTQHLRHLLDDLLDVSRITQGKIQLRDERIETSNLIAKAVEVIRPALEKKKHHLTVEITPGEMTILGDPTRLEQVLVNLLTNAIKFTDEGGRIAIRAHNGSEVVLTVEDNGVGIDTEMLPRVFDLFAQADRSLDKSHGGLGLGLTLARKLVELHRGQISATSKGIGQGSIFRVALPLAVGLSPAKRSEEHGFQVAPQKGFRVLIADDNRDMANALKIMLAHNGYETVTAFDGDAALEIALSTNPHAIILDIGLPGIDGYEVARRLRASADCRNAIIVAISGYSQEDDRRRSREAGIDHHLVKPVDFAELSALLADSVQVDMDAPNGNQES